MRWWNKLRVEIDGEYSYIYELSYGRWRSYCPFSVDQLGEVLYERYEVILLHLNKRGLKTVLLDARPRILGGFGEARAKLAVADGKEWIVTADKEGNSFRLLAINAIVLVLPWQTNH